MESLQTGADSHQHYPYKIFQKWYHYTRFLKLDKIHRHQVRVNQRRRIQDMMNEANIAFEKHDAYQLFKILNKNCPKQRLKRIRLKSSTGQFLSPVEETAEYCRYIAEAWSGPAMVIPTLPAPGIPFTVDELEHALEGIPATKAVAPPYAPGSAWKSQAHYIAPWLMTQLEIWWNTSPPFIPQGWKDGWVVFLPKPQKASTKVENLRVLALQDPVGKCIVKRLTQKALRICLPQICHHPQFAYLPFRSTREALMRVANHCDAVRQLLKGQARSIHITKQEQPRLACGGGGVQIFLDTHRAFDQLPRQLIIEALQRAGLNDNLLSLLVHWHQNTYYHLHTNQANRKVHVSRGVRQGCCAAPFIWACVISLVMKNLEDQIPQEWPQSCLTIFADDFHMASVFRSESELLQTMSYFGIILTELKRMGFILNPHKSCAIIRGSGSRFLHWKKQNVKRSKTQQTKGLKIPQTDAEVIIPIKDRSLYLGTVMSYDNFEMQSLRLRLQVGWSQFRRLQRWLCGRKKVHIKLRLQIMNTCILPCVCCGILFTGMTVHGLQQLQTQLTAMYRKIAGNLAHVTGLTNQAFFDSYHIRSPAATVSDLWRQAREGLITARKHVPATDIVHITDWSSLQRTRLALDLLESGLLREPLKAQVLHCQYCDAVFSHPNLLQRHLTRTHQKPRQVIKRLDIMKDSYEGKAICAYCQKSFTTWSSFTFHIQNQICASRQHETLEVPHAIKS